MKRRPVIAWTAGALVMGSLVLAQMAGFRINTSSSMPVGLWHVAPMDRAPVSGDVVTFCLPDVPELHLAAQRGYVAAGSCPGDLEPLIKPVAAVAGDLVLVTPAGISVNGIGVAGTVQLDRDTGGRPLQPVPAGAYRVQPRRVWLLAGYARNSFDSRYFGSVPVDSVQAVARPVWVR